MTRLFVLAIVLGLALIVMLVWVSGGAGKGVEERNKLLDREGQAKAAARHDTGTTASRFPDVPKTEAFEALRIEWPEGDARRKAGGPVVLSARGNLVVFRRKSLAQPAWARTILADAKRSALLEKALALPEAAILGPDRFPVTVRDGKKVAKRTGTAEDVEALLEASTGQNTPFIPPPFRLRLEEFQGEPAAGAARPWPAASGIPDPGTFTGDGGEVKGTTESRTRLLAVLEPGAILLHQAAGRPFRVLDYEFLLP